MNSKLFIKTSRDFFTKTSKEGLLVLSPDEDILYILKGAASFIYERSNGKRRIKEIIKDVLGEFSAEPHVVEGDVLAFLEDAVKQDPPLFIFSECPA